MANFSYQTKIYCQIELILTDINKNGIALKKPFFILEN